jgi:hypothetical protein
MNRRKAAAPMVALMALGVSAAALPAQTGGVTRTFNAPLERVWTVTESVLKSLGWEVDKRDRDVGWILTNSRGVEFKDFGVYGDGTRHKLRLTLKAVGDGRTSVSVERELYKEERILWMREKKPLKAADQSMETATLNAIEKSL